MSTDSIERSDKRILCLALSVLIIIFVIGYTIGFYVYHRPQKRVPRVTLNSDKTVYVPTVQPGPGSERFHNIVDNKDDDSDHDNQIIRRIKK